MWRKEPTATDVARVAARTADDHRRELATLVKDTARVLAEVCRRNGMIEEERELLKAIERVCRPLGDRPSVGELTKAHDEAMNVTVVASQRGAPRMTQAHECDDAPFPKLPGAR